MDQEKSLRLGGWKIIIFFVVGRYNAAVKVLNVYQIRSFPEHIQV